MIPRRASMGRRWGVTFQTDAGTFHSYSQLGLLPAAPPTIAPAVTETKSIRVPGADGRLYLQLTDDPTFDVREGVFPFYAAGGEKRRYALYAKAQAALHAREAIIALDEDPAYYWTGRLTVDALGHTTGAGQITVRAEMGPFKYMRRSTELAWYWDTFCFEDGVIRDYGAIEVPSSASKTINFVSSPVGGSPEFKSDKEGVTITIGGTTYTISSADAWTTFAGIVLPRGQTEVAMTLSYSGSGTATVSISYRPGYL